MADLKVRTISPLPNQTFADAAQRHVCHADRHARAGGCAARAPRGEMLADESAIKQVSATDLIELDRLVDKVWRSRTAAALMPEIRNLEQTHMAGQ